MSSTDLWQLDAVYQSLSSIEETSEQPESFASLSQATEDLMDWAAAAGGDGQGHESTISEAESFREPETPTETSAWTEQTVSLAGGATADCAIHGNLWGAYEEDGEQPVEEEGGEQSEEEAITNAAWVYVLSQEYYDKNNKLLYVICIDINERTIHPHRRVKLSNGSFRYLCYGEHLKPGFKTFALAGGFNRHFDLRHLEKRPYVCSNCGSMFSRNDQLKSHMGRPICSSGNISYNPNRVVRRALRRRGR